MTLRETLTATLQKYYDSAPKQHICFECRELVNGYCMAAKRRNISSAPLNYRPAKYTRRVCGWFKLGGVSHE